MDQLHITEYQTTTTPPLPDNTPYTQTYTGRVSTTLTTTSNSTFTNGLHTTHSLHPGRPPDAPLQFHTAQRFTTCSSQRPLLPHNFTTHYNWQQHQLRHHPTTDWTTTTPEVGQFLHFTRDYISYMMSVQQNYYLPTTQHPQTIRKVDYDMTTFTDNYSLRNNYIWNYHMPLLLPELLHYLYNRDQLHATQGHYYHPLQEHPVLRFYITHHDQPYPTPQGTPTSFPQGL